MSIKIKYTRNSYGMIVVTKVEALTAWDLPQDYLQGDMHCYREDKNLIIKYKGSLRRVTVGGTYTPAEFEALLTMIRECGEVLYKMDTKPKFQAKYYEVKI